VTKGSGHRGLHERVKTARGRKPSSQRWLERQLNDPYVARSKQEGYRSRAAYKLLEIDERYKLLKPGQRIVDLGAAPGGWSQVAAARLGSTDADPRIVAIDYLGMDALPGVTVLQKDFLDDDAPAALKAALGGHKADLVMSGSWRSATPPLISPARFSPPAGPFWQKSSAAAPRTLCSRR
jgi:23S rRNA (uridine2552-2'-O)-methyltransferase